MKKNFFKKLSFILALAMIVTALAPASGVFAAAKAPKLNATSKTLHLGGITGVNKFDFNIANKQTGWKYLWKSSDASVASVNKSNGLVTAKSVGTTKISVVISDKKGEEVDTLTATVYVRDNIKELTITNKPAGDKVAVGVEHDFNRSYKTEAGKTSGSKVAVTRWTVVNAEGKAEGATISDSGVFKATVPGEYTITANAFQSKSKYTEWLTSQNAKLVTATTSTKVTVATSMVKAEQVDLDTLKVTFDSAITDASKLSVVYLVGTAEVLTAVKKTTLSADGKEVVVDMYANLPEGSTIVVKYPEMDSKQFVAAKSDASEVKSIEIATTKVQIGPPDYLYVKFLNKDGVNIAKPDLYSRLTFETSNINAFVTEGTAPTIVMYKVGDTTTVTATFHTWTYDPTTGAEVGNLTASGVITCVEKSVDKLGDLSAYTLVDYSTGVPDFSDAKHTVSLSDDARLYVQLKGTKANGDELLTNNYPSSPNYGSAKTWSYSSSDINVLNVDSTGHIFTFKTGTAVVIVKYGDDVVATCPITVTAARELATFSVSANQFVLSNDDDVLDTKDITVTVKDQFGSDYTAYTLATPVKKSNNVGTAYVSHTNTSVRFGGATLATGAYTYELKVTDNNNSNISKSVYVTVTVAQPSSDDDVSYYSIELNKNAFDTKLTDTDDNEKAVVSLFGYAANGVRNKRLDANTLVTVTAPAGATNLPATSASITQPNDLVLDLIPTAMTKASKGSYTLRVASGTILAANSFTVTDTQPAPTLVVNKTISTAATLTAALADCFTVKVDGVATAITGQDVHGSVVGTNGTSVYVKSVTVSKTYGAAGTLTFTVPVNATITYNYH